MNSTAVDAKTINNWLRQRRRANRIRPGDLLFRIYVTALFGLPVLWYLQRAIVLDELVPAPSTQSAIRERAATLLPALSLLGLVGGLRFGVWQGPVVLSKTDLRWVLTAPTPRRALLIGPLARGLGAAALLGAVAGTTLATGAAVAFDADFVELLITSAASFGLYGALIGALAWFIECSPARARIVVRVTPVIVTAALTIAIAGTVTQPWVGLWGPPGWVSAPLLAGTGAAPWAWGPLASALAVVSLLTVRAALRQADAVPFEQLELRATFGAGFRASIFFLDLRSAGLARRAAKQAIVGRTARRVRPPSVRLLVPVWVHTLHVVRSGRVPRLVVGIASSLSMVAITPSSGPGLVLGAVAVAATAYVAASALIEPVWAEVERPFGLYHLRGSWRQVLTHTIVAGTALAAVMTTSTAVLVLARPGLDPLIIAIGPVLGLTALAAAVPPTGPPPDISLLLYGGSGLAVLTISALRGPLTAVALVGPAAAALLSTAGSETVGAALGVTAIAVALAVPSLKYRLDRLTVDVS